MTKIVNGLFSIPAGSMLILSQIVDALKFLNWKQRNPVVGQEVKLFMIILGLIFPTLFSVIMHFV